MTKNHEPNDNPFRAFPSNAAEDAYGGMSLRDWFAGQALAGICSNLTDDMRAATDWSIEASDAYNASDAMMAERVKGGE